MKSTGMNKLTGLGAVSIAALCLVWSGLSNGNGVSTDYTTVSRASVKIQSFEQTGEGETQKVTVRTKDVINYLIGGGPGEKVPGNLRLVLLNYCGNPQGDSALAVWDKEQDDLVDTEVACLFRDGSAIFNDNRNTIYRPLGFEGSAFMMDRINMDVAIKLGRVRGNLFEETPEERPECLKRFSTMAMSGDDDDSDNRRVMRKSGFIKTNGSVFAVEEGNVIFDVFDCD